MQKELIRRFLKRYASNFWVIFTASLLINLLVFTGSVYMMLVYDSVLPSRSLPTLFSLFGMLALVYAVQGVLEVTRAEAMLTAANGVHRDLLSAVHFAAVSRTLRSQREGEGLQLTRDLDHIHSFLTGAGPLAIIDLPWVLVFLVVLAAMHWALGLAALIGACLMAAIAWWTSQRSAAGTKELTALTSQRIGAVQTELRFAEAANAMGMQDRLLMRSRMMNERYLEAQSYLSRTISRLGGVSRLLRLFLQSAMLTVGAVLVIAGNASGGVILAASILSGRALAPVDMAIANWRGLASARSGWQRIVDAIYAYQRPEPRSVVLTPPTGELVARDIWVVPPGSRTAALSGVSLAIQPGQALAIIGPSAAGKSTLARALLGVWPLSRGEIRIDGATHDQWDREVIGASFGYLPQSIDLLEGTIGENIARFDPSASSEAVVAAAKAAGMHEMILGFASGYDTAVSQGGLELSAGQRQRIGLARALYGDPHLVVLDEPNSNLDAAGDAALEQAIIGVRRRGGITVMVTHRPSTLGPVSHVALLANGQLADFGERDAVLQRMQQRQQAQGKPDTPQQVRGANSKEAAPS